MIKFRNEILHIEIERSKRTFAQSDMLRTETFLNVNITKRRFFNRIKIAKRKRFRNVTLYK